MLLASPSRLSRLAVSALSALSAIAGVGTLASCSASKDSPPEFDDPDVMGRSANPEGVPYPTDHIGGAQRAGGRPGDRIQNFSFQAYVDGDRSALKTVSLADYFDPTGKRFKVLDIQVSATWCSVCSQVTTSTIPVRAKLLTEGAVILEVIVAGNSPAAGPSLAEVDTWVTSHQSTVTTAIDVRGHRLGAVGVDKTVVPFDLLIDLRTMEILDASAGAPQNFDITAYAHEGLTFVASHPPSY